MTLILEQMKEYHLNDHQAEELARAIISNVFLPQISKNKGKKSLYFHLSLQMLLRLLLNLYIAVLVVLKVFQAITAKC